MDDSKKTPLERYLEKQKKTREPKPPSSIEARRAQTPAPTSARAQFRTLDDIQKPKEDPKEQKALAQGVPAAPPPPSSMDSLGAEFMRTRETPAQTLAPSTQQGADVGTRLIAWVIDLVILYCIQWPITKVVVGALGIISSTFAGDSRRALEYLLAYTVLFFYYGYFYSKKAASPGKMLLGLSIFDEATEQPLSVWKAFFRETLGKFISAVPFFIGFIVALFRYDRRALHDLLFDTRVVRNIRPSRTGISR